MEELATIEKRLTAKDCTPERLAEVNRCYELAESKDLKVVAEALQTIPRILAHHRRRLASAEKESPANAAVAEWLGKHLEAYHATLGQLATSSSPRAQVCAIRLAMAVLQDEAEEQRTSRAASAALAVPPPDTRIQGLVTELLLAESFSEHVIDSLMGEFAGFVDVRHFVLCHLKYCTEQCGKQASSAPRADGGEGPAPKRRKVSAFVEAMRSRGRTSEDVFVRALALLKAAPEPEPAAPAGSADGGEAADAPMLFPGRPAGFFLREYRKLFQDAWISLLSLPTPLSQCTSLLQHVPAQVMPHLSQPLLLADFYLRAFNSSSLEVSVLSLSGLLLLLTRHGLGDPETISNTGGEYFARLYSLLDVATFRLKRRARFQRLLSASLSSGLLPARYAAVFAKKCIRVAIACTEPGSVMWLVATAYSLIQKHHSHCKFLLHNPYEGPMADKPPAAEKDPFSSSSSLSEALDQIPGSSLWEIQLLLRHHAPAVVLLAKLFVRPFFGVTARKLEPELFLDQSFERMYKQALKAGDRQMNKWRSRGERCPVAFQVDDGEEGGDPSPALRVAGWVAALSTQQRRIGAGI